MYKVLYSVLLLLVSFCTVLAAPVNGTDGSSNDTDIAPPSGGGGGGGGIVVGYFPNWLGSRYAVSDIDFSKYTHIHYAFAIMTSGDTPQWTDDATIDTQLSSLVSAAHAANAKVLISVGGWSGSITFSSMVASAASRANFIQWNIEQIKSYKTDGVDIDWEYPGKIGAGCNVFDTANDMKNFATLLSELRTALDKSFDKGSKELSIAGHVGGFTDASPGDIKSISNSLDRVNIMSYDINGAWNTQTGANSPLKAANGGPSFTSGISAWTSSGFPASKLTGGLPFYGRSTTAKENMLSSNGSTSMTQDQIQGKSPKGDSYDAVYQDPYCSNDPAGLSGVWRFGNLISEGVLATPLTAKEPWVRTWDDDTQTPWLFHPETKAFISYDDPKSIAIKANHAKSSGLAGVMIWSVDQDDSQGSLLKAAT